MIYLDFAAATPVDEDVMERMQSIRKAHYYNPSGVTVASRQTKKILEDARSSIAGTIGAKSSEIIFTAGGTEANNLAVSGVLRMHPKSTVLLSQLEHSSIKVPVEKWGSELLFEVNDDGQIEPETIKKSIQDDTVLVTVAYADSELGVIQPIKDIARLAEVVRDERHGKGINVPLYLHIDASQAAGHLDLNVNRLGVDMMTLNAGKFYGPKQMAALYISKDTSIEPLVYGGGQEHGMRAGTENVAAATGMALALEKAEDRRKETTDNLTVMQRKIIKSLQSIEGCTINGSLRNRLPNNINARFIGVRGEDVVLFLEQAGIIIGTGAACSVGKETPSDALLAIGLSAEEANQSIRITLSHTLQEEDVSSFMDEFPKVITKVRNLYN